MHFFSEMSQITLLNDDDARYLDLLAQSNEKQGIEWQSSHQYYHPNIQVTDTQAEGSIEEDSDEQVYYDPPVIHMLRLGDSMKSICKKYDIHVF